MKYLFAESKSVLPEELRVLFGLHIAVSPATEEEVRSGYVGRQLREFNYRYVSEFPEPQYIRLNARSDRQVVGGLRAVVAMYWLRLEVLWVSEDMRGQGIGSRLLADAERIARYLGSKNAALETFEWQAPGFYARHGYEEVARMDKYIGDFFLAVMRKAL